MSRRAPLIGVGAGLLILLAFWFLLYSPRSDEQAAFVAETVALQSQQAQLRNQITALESIRDNQETIREALRQLTEYIPDGVEQPTVVRLLQVSADAAGIGIDTVTFNQPELVEDAPATGEPGTALAQVSVTMTMEGGYFQIVDFFRRLEVDVRRAVLVDNFSVAEGSDGFPSLSTTWGGRLFTVVPVAEALPPGTAPPPTAPAAPGAPVAPVVPAPSAGPPVPAETVTPS